MTALAGDARDHGGEVRPGLHARRVAAKATGDRGCVLAHAQGEHGIGRRGAAMADRPRRMVKGTVLGKPVFKECALIASDGRYGLGAGAEGPFEQGGHSLLALGDRH